MFVWSSCSLTDSPVARNLLLFPRSFEGVWAWLLEPGPSVFACLSLVGVVFLYCEPVSRPARWPCRYGDTDDYAARLWLEEPGLVGVFAVAALLVACAYRLALATMWAVSVGVKTVFVKNCLTRSVS